MNPILQRISVRLKAIIFSSIVSMGLISAAIYTAVSFAADPAESQSLDSAVPKLVWEQRSSNGVFNVTLDPQIDPTTDDSIEINQFLEWILTVKTADDQIVSPARVTVSGGMPMHGHGLPSQPQVSEYLGDGKYLLKGLMFSMNGRWTIELDIISKSLRDQVLFEIKLDP